MDFTGIDAICRCSFMIKTFFLILMVALFYLFSVAPEPVANCTTINPSAEHFRLSCKPGFDGGMEQFFEVTVRENNSGTIVYNLTITNKLEKLDIKNLSAGMSYIATVRISPILFSIFFTSASGTYWVNPIMCPWFAVSKYWCELYFVLSSIADLVYLHYRKNMSRVM